MKKEGPRKGRHFYDGEPAVGWRTMKEKDGEKWCSCTTKKAQLWAKKEQRRTQKEEGGYLKVLMGYRRWNQGNGTWEEKEGFIQVEPGAFLQVRTKMSDRMLREDLFDELKETSFKRPERRRVEAAFEKLGQSSKKAKEEEAERSEAFQVDVSEVYSPPRMVEEAQRQHLRGGTSFDILTGWDLTDEKARARMWKKLVEEEPWLIVLSPPCTAFSILQGWNFPRMKKKKVVQMIQLGLEHLGLVCEIIKWQVSRGGYVVFEHPRGARSWQQQCVQEMLPEVIVTDPGREFLAEFIELATQSGVVVHQTAARAPWQQGKTERHGAHFKEILEKARVETLVTTTEELNLLMREVEQAKNRFSNRSGFSPVQRQIGQWPRLPAELTGDDVVDPERWLEELWSMRWRRPMR